MIAEKCLVLLSGGQDSATCLAWAEHQFPFVYCVSFDYGQRHYVELECAKRIAAWRDWRHDVLPINTFAALGDSSLLDQEQDVEAQHKLAPNLPSSFVPGRNMVFLTAAAALAYKLGIRHLVTGVCQTDYSGYPDCRAATIKSIELSLTLAMGQEQNPFVIHTPLMWLTKAETVLLMKDLGGLPLYKHTHTCYQGIRPPCGKCPACVLRAKGFEEAGIPDPLLEG